MLLREDLNQHRCFPVKFPRILRTSFLKESLWWLLLNRLLMGPAKARKQKIQEKLLSESIFQIFDTSYLPLQNKKFKETF